MKLCLHICCGPCAVYPVPLLRDAGHEVMGFFTRINIHPFTECQRREETLLDWAEKIDLRVVVQKEYDLEGFLRGVAFREEDRCRFCYHERLTATAKLAKHGRFEAFSTTLLYSRFQKHELITEIGQAVGKREGIPFYYQDFREGWKLGIEESKSLGMYRQQYCGCIYSEKDRYYHPGKENKPVSGD